jgi:hypothetical protein
MPLSENSRSIEAIALVFSGGSPETIESDNDVRAEGARMVLPINSP